MLIIIILGTALTILLSLSIHLYVFTIAGTHARITLLHISAE